MKILLGLQSKFLLGYLLTSMVSLPVLADQFPIEQLPIGSEVTVPPTAKTIVPMGTQVKFSSTDNPQTLRIVPIGNGSTFAAPIRLAIYDKNLDRVKYVNVSPNAPFLYSFKGLSTITIQPTLQGANAMAGSGVRMEVESDKAVTLVR